MINSESKPWIKDVGEVSPLHNGWECFVVFMLETEALFYGMVELVNKMMASCKRKRVRVISEETVHKMALDHCSKTGEQTPFSALCEAVKVAGGYRFREKIPTELLAYMIKYIILKERNNFLKARRNAGIVKYRAAIRYATMALKYDLEIKDDHSANDSPTIRQDKQRKGVVNGKLKKTEKEGLSGKDVEKKGNVEYNRGKKIKQKHIEKNESETEGSEEVRFRKEDEKLLQQYLKKCILSQQKLEAKDEAGVFRCGLKKCLENLKNVGKEGRFKEEEDEEELEEEQEEDLEGELLDEEELEEDEDEEDDDEEEEEEEEVIVETVEKYQELGDEAEKIDTLLHKHGEAIRDMYTIDDSPLNGPDMYIFISSFKDPVLPEVLHQINIPLNGYIFVGYPVSEAKPISKDGILFCNSYYDIYEEYMKEYGNQCLFVSAKAIANSSDKRNLKPLNFYENIENELAHFYTEFYKKVVKMESYEQFENVIMTTYVPHLKVVDFNNSVWLKEMSHLLYEDISSIGYYFYGITSMYPEYLEAVPCIDLTVKSELPVSIMAYYNSLLDRIPNEMINLPIILDTIIAQVCSNELTDIGYQPADYHIQEENSNGKIYLKNFKKEKKYCKKTECILFADKIALATYKLGELGRLIRDRCEHILSVFFNKKWIKLIEPIEKTETVYGMFHFQSLLHACEHLDIKDGSTVLNILLSTMAVEIKMAEKKVCTELSSKIITHNPSNNSSDRISSSAIFTEYIIGHEFISEIIKNINNENIKLLSNIQNFEEMPKRVFLQTLWQVYQDYNNIEMYYVPVIHKALLICYNAPLRKIKEGKIPNYLTLREFYKSTLEVLKDWCDKQEREIIISNYLKGEICTEIDGLIFRSVEAVEAIKISQNLRLFAIPEWERKFVAFTDRLPNKGTYPKKRREIRKIVFDKTKQFFCDFGTINNEPFFTIFLSYIFIQSTIITIKIFSQFYQPIKLTVITKQNDHTLTFHSPLYTNNKPKSVLFSHTSGIKMVFFEVNQENIGTVKNESLNIRNSINKYANSKSKQNILNVDLVNNYYEQNDNGTQQSTDQNKLSSKEIDYYSCFADLAGYAKYGEQTNLPEIKDPCAKMPCNFGFKFSLPNGLVVESKCLPQDNFSYIKQYYCFKTSDNTYLGNEKCRFHLDNGEVIKVRRDNLVEIYHPSGRWITSSDVNFGNFFTSHGENVQPKKNDDSKGNQGTEVIGNDSSISLGTGYFLMEPDATYYLVNDKSCTVIDKKETFESYDIFRDTRTVTVDGGPTYTFNGGNIQTVTFLDGTRITSEAGIAEEEVFCEWSIKELKKWFRGDWSDGESDEEEEYDDDDYDYDYVESETKATEEEGEVEEYWGEEDKGMGYEEEEGEEEEFGKEEDIEIEYGEEEEEEEEDDEVEEEEEEIEDEEEEEEEEEEGSKEEEDKCMEEEGEEGKEEEEGEEDESMEEEEEEEEEEGEEDECLEEEDEEIEGWEEEDEYKEVIEEEIEGEEEEDEYKEEVDVEIEWKEEIEEEIEGEEEEKADIEEEECRVEEDQASCSTEEEEEKGEEECDEEIEVGAEDDDEGAESIRKKILIILINLYRRFAKKQFARWKKINLTEDGFLWVTITPRMMEHPCYVTTSLFPDEDNKVVHQLAHDIKLIRFDNGCLDLYAGQDILLRIRNDEIIFENCKQNDLMQRSFFLFNAFKTAKVYLNPEIFFKTFDKLGNWLTIDTSGRIKYHIDSELEMDNLRNIFKTSLPTTDLSMNCTRILVMDRNLSGIELLSTHNVNSFSAIYSAEQCSLTKVFAEDPFICQVFLLPMWIDNIQCLWSYRDSIKEALDQLPSTYGDTWQFPFLSKSQKNCLLPQIVKVRFVNKLIVGDTGEMFENILEEYLKIIFSRTQVNGNEIYSPGQESFKPRKSPKTCLGKEAVWLRNELFKKDILLVNLYKLRLYKERKYTYGFNKKLRTKYRQKFFKKITHDIFVNNYIPYFESGSGIAFLILDNTITRAFHTLTAIEGESN